MHQIYAKREIIKMAYQPIIEISNNRVYGYEALLRPPAGKPEEIIKKAERSGTLLELEQLICSKVVEQFCKKNNDTIVFINLTPYSFAYDGGFTIMESLSPLNSKKVVIEITEDIKLPQGITNIVKNWRNKGYKLAVDDISQGFSRLSAVASINPEFIKIDRTCITNALTSEVWGKVLEGIVRMAKSINSKTIGEGIETDQERELLDKFRIDYGQGHYFGKPIIIEKVS